jgi:hypothetical protein
MRPESVARAARRQPPLGSQHREECEQVLLVAGRQRQEGGARRRALAIVTQDRILDRGRAAVVEEVRGVDEPQPPERLRATPS